MWSLILILVVAQAADPSSQANQLIEAGVDARAAGDDRGALLMFQQAYDLDPTPRAVGQLGLVLVALGRFAEGETNLERALAMDSDPWIKAQRVALDGALATARQRLGDLEVAVNVPGAVIRVDGQDRGEAPLARPLRVTAGTVVIEVSAVGYFPVQRSVAVPAQRLAREVVVLVQAKAAPPPEAQAPVASSPQPAPTALTPPPRPAEPPSKGPWPWALGGAAVAGIAGGVAGLMVGEGRVQDWNGRCAASATTPGCESVEGSWAVPRVLGGLSLLIGIAAGSAAAYLIVRED